MTTGLTMDLLTSLDPTAVCITLLIAAFTLLWLYVSMTGTRREQPNLSALYEQTSLRPSSAASGQSSRSPRAAPVKGKGKNKLVEGSPRPSVQKTTTSETAAISSEKAALPTQQAAQTSKASSDATPVPKSAIGNKGKKKRQAALASETDSGPKLQPEEGDDGEWQTQLSRQQLKALRQKQKKEKAKEKAAEREREETSKSSSSDTDGKQVSTATPSSSDNGEGHKKGQKKEREAEEPSSKSKEVGEERAGGKSDGSRRGKGNRQKTSEADSGAKSTDKQQLMVGKEEEKATGSEQTGSGAAVSACVSDVEEALKDAARSTSTSPEADNQSAETEAPFTEVKSKSHRKQKATTKESSSPEDQPGLDTGEHDEEWVVIEGESLT